MWIRFYYKIDIMATSLKLKTMQEEDFARISTNLKICNVMSALFIISMLGFATGVTIDHDTFIPSGDFTPEEMAKFYSPIHLCTGITFGIEGLLFLGISLLTILKIKQLFP